VFCENKTTPRETKQTHEAKQYTRTAQASAYRYNSIRGLQRSARLGSARLSQVCSTRSLSIFDWLID
jgi:hypothetical protein